MIEKACLVILNNPTAQLREAVHTVIKAHSSQWWHHFANVWLVSDHDPSFWANEIASDVGNVQFMVFELPDNASNRNWTGALPVDSMDADSWGGPIGWLEVNYTGNTIGGSAKRFNATRKKPKELT